MAYFFSAAITCNFEQATEHMEEGDMERVAVHLEVSPRCT